MAMLSPIQIRRAAERGHARHCWLDSRHTFSFGEYQDPAHVGFRSLRVINEDRVAPLGGFPTHPHRDMEIFSYILGGRLAHRDSLGNERVLAPGDVQLMSAGSGVTHSESNPSPSEPVHFLQVWIQPSERGLAPTYTEWQPAASAPGPAVLLISPDGRDGSARIAQDAWIHRLRLKRDAVFRCEVRPGRGLWLQVVRGAFGWEGSTLRAGDAAATEVAGVACFRGAAEESEALLFDLA